MPDAHANFAYSTVATAPSPATSGATLVVAAGDGAKFPAPPFNATVWPANAQPLASNAEIVRVTAVSTDTLTITRAQEGSTARSILAGDQIAATITAKTLTDVESATAASFLRVVIAEPAGTDITAQIQNAINTAVTAGQDLDLLVMSTTNGPLHVDGAVQTGTALSETYAGQILFPARHFDAGRLSIRIRGANPVPASASRETSTTTGEPAYASGTVLLSSATSGYVFDAIAADSIFGSPLTDLFVTFEDIVVRCPDNPQCGGVNGYRLASLTCEDVSIDVNAIGESITFPTGANPGLIAPREGNMCQSSFRGQVVGFPVGVRHSEHFHFTEGNVLNCAVAFQLDNCQHLAQYDRVQVSKCPTVMQAYGSNNSVVLGHIDYEIGASSTGTSWQAKYLVDDVNGYLHGLIKFNNQTAWTGGTMQGIGINGPTAAPLNLDLQNAYDSRSSWKNTRPVDTFHRSPSLSSATNVQPGTTDHALHPWIGASGTWQFPADGQLKRYSGTGIAACPYYIEDGGDQGSAGARIVKASLTTATSSYDAGVVVGYVPGTGKHLRVELTGGTVNLVAATGATANATLTSGGTVAASTAYDVYVVCRFDPTPGASMRIEVWLGTTQMIDYTLTATDEGYLTNVGQLLRCDGLFSGSSDASVFTEFRVMPLSTGKSGLSTVTVADIEASGTPSASTYLRGDGSWQTPTGGSGGYGAWASFTPTLTADTTNPTLGTGATQQGFYRTDGHTIDMDIKIGFGSSGANAGSGNYRIPTPAGYTLDTTIANRVVGVAAFFHSSSGANEQGVVRVLDSATLWLSLPATPNTVASGVPWAWAASDSIVLTASCQLA